MEQDFNKKIHKFGIISGTCIFLMMMAIPVIVSLMAGYFPDFIKLVPALGMICFVLFTCFFIEMITYPPLIGPGSLYLCYVTGNLVNIKFPCVLASLESANVKSGTNEANAVSMIASGVSSIVTMLVIAVGLVFMIPLEPVLQMPSLQPVFDNVVPAMFGSLVATKILTEKKLFLSALILCCICTFVLGLNQNIAMLLCLLTLIIMDRVSRKRHQNK